MNHSEATRGARFGKPVAPAFLPTYARVLSMLADGIGFSEIARRLNAADVPTARGGRWYASTIKAMADSETAKRL